MFAIQCIIQFLETKANADLLTGNNVLWKKATAVI